MTKTVSLWASFAARICLKGQDTNEIDGLIFATTTSPYVEKKCSAIIATALDLRRDILTSDLTDGLRAGTNALKAAMDSVKAGSAKKILVVVSDNRQGPPRGEIERNSGDGSVALLISNEPTIAQLIGSHSISDNLIDNWRGYRGRFFYVVGKTDLQLKKVWNG
ncbi:MAG: hypothetical protein CM1200mP22_34020 [Dehalococcoidia bacterium]|nr:MAG: hypothetical protein CM1200mP22_34020 [Dehalococcoidia bacterium]